MIIEACSCVNLLFNKSKHIYLNNVLLITILLFISTLCIRLANLVKSVN